MHLGCLGNFWNLKLFPLLRDFPATWSWWEAEPVFHLRRQKARSHFSSRSCFLGRLSHLDVHNNTLSWEEGIQRSGGLRECILVAAASTGEGSNTHDDHRRDVSRHIQHSCNSGSAWPKSHGAWIWLGFWWPGIPHSGPFSAPSSPTSSAIL